MAQELRNPLYEKGWHLNEDEQCYEMFVFDEVVARIAVEEIEASMFGIYDLMAMKQKDAERRFKQHYIEEIQRDLIGNPLPLIPATKDWLKAHERADLIEYNKIEEDDGMTRMIPFRAIYNSPIAKFQEVMKASPKRIPWSEYRKRHEPSQA